MIFIDAVPVRKRSTGRVEFWAHVRLPGSGFEELAEYAVEQTGQRAEIITTFDLSEGVPEDEVRTSPDI
jgi:hypothetical protein